MFLGLDIGTSSVKGVLIDGRQRIIATASAPLTVSRPQSGWSEQNPDDWYDAFVDTVRSALALAGPAGEVVAISFSAGAHTPVILGEDLRPLRPAILWNDQRSGAEATELNEKHGDRLLASGYQRAAPTWTLAQLAWLARHEPEVVAKARHLLVAKDYLRFRVTGRLASDEVDALGTLLLDAPSRAWSAELCGFAGWPFETLPEILRSTDPAGEVSQEVAAATGLRAGTPVIAGASDTAIEAFGAGAVRPGDGVVKLASAGTLSIITDRPHPDARVITYYHVVPGFWYQLTATNSCASAHRWLRDLLFPGDAGDGFAEMDRLAAGVPAGSEGLLFHPYLNGERSPYWDPDLRADFVGLTFRHRRAHLARALYEGVAFSLRDCLGGLESVGLKMTSARIVGGGAQSGVWRQVVADVLGVEVSKPVDDDASYGAALLAGVGIGAFRDCREAVERCVRVQERHEPDAARGRLYDEMFGLYREAQRGLAGVSHALGRVEILT